MREKTMRFLVTFPTTAGAMAMEKACEAAGVPGRLIPVPRAITAGCGMSWISPPEQREQVQALIARLGLNISGTYEMLI